MQKYSAIIDRKTGYVMLICVAFTYYCIETNFSFNLNVTLLSIAVIFPLVFTIRQSFRRRDEVIKVLSVFRSSMNAVYHSFVQVEKLEIKQKELVGQRLQNISTLFLSALQGEQDAAEKMPDDLAQIFKMLQENRSVISNGVALKIIRFLKDVEESMEHVIGIKTHGLPISLRAYCLVFIYLFPFVFIPTLVYTMEPGNGWIVYILGMIHGFVLISLYNLQCDLEDPFDQIGLDDVRLDVFQFQNEEPIVVAQEKQPKTAT